MAEPSVTKDRAVDHVASGHHMDREHLNKLVTKFLSIKDPTGPDDGISEIYIREKKNQLSHLFKTFNVRLSRTVYKIMEDLEGGDSNPKESKRIMQYLGRKFSDQMRMHADWERRWEKALRP